MKEWAFMFSARSSISALIFDVFALLLWARLGFGHWRAVKGNGCKWTKSTQNVCLISLPYSHWDRKMFILDFYIVTQLVTAVVHQKLHHCVTGMWKFYKYSCDPEKWMKFKQWTTYRFQIYQAWAEIKRKKKTLMRHGILQVIFNKYFTI